MLTVLAELQQTSCQLESVTSQSNNSSLPVSYSATIVDGGEQVCPPEEEQEMIRADIGQDVRNIIRNVILCRGLVQDNPASSCLEVSQCNPQLPSGYYWIASSTSNGPVYCDMDRQCDCSAGVGGWSRVAYLNMSDPTHQCPPAWREITEPVRTCGRTNQTLVSPFFGTAFGLGGCSSAFFSTSISYSHVCGRIIGYQIGSANGFQPYNAGWYTRIEDPYVDGVVITCGTVKKHIWTFAVDDCPCNTQPGYSTPPYVGEDYFCESGDRVPNVVFVLVISSGMERTVELESTCC